MSNTARGYRGRRMWNRLQTHRCLGQTQNAAVLNVQTILRHTNKQACRHGDKGLRRTPKIIHAHILLQFLCISEDCTSRHRRRQQEVHSSHYQRMTHPAYVLFIYQRQNRPTLKTGLDPLRLGCCLHHDPVWLLNLEQKTKRFKLIYKTECTWTDVTKYFSPNLHLISNKASQSLLFMPLTNEPCSFA